MLNEGVRLGLATVYGIVRQHHGMIHVYSEVGKGTTFKIYLPMVEHFKEGKQEVAPAPPRGGTETILVAEDDANVLTVIEDILTRAGYTVLKAVDGDDAIRVFDEHAEDIDLLVFDVVMPNLGGPAAFDKIRRKRAGTRVLFASGYTAGALHTNFVIEGNMQLIQKPYSHVQILSKVREILDSEQ